MGTTITVERNQLLPFEIVVDRNGGLTGLTMQAALRAGNTGSTYLDFADNTFKTSGWTTKYTTLADIGNGHYYATLNLALLSIAAYPYMVIEYHLNSGGVKGEDADMVQFTDVPTDLRLIKKQFFNRLEEKAGNPGTLTLYDDDSTTVLATWDLRDEQGNAIGQALGTPARRSKATF